MYKQPSVFNQLPADGQLDVSSRSLLQAKLRLKTLHTRPCVLLRVRSFVRFLEIQSVDIFYFNGYCQTGVKPALLGILKTKMRRAT